mmetsp:Transcript_50398/g.132748  ORF Transcript_50398/g.132748 Transcript_50398/m.132748 type:complete len:700 (-) Transcript_50398:7-2106(-)
MSDVPPAEFEGEVFNAEELLKKYRRRLPLSRFHACLSEYGDSVKADLVELINDQYAVFVSLSGQMKAVEQKSIGLEVPLDESRGFALDFRQQLEDILQSADEKLSRRAAITARVRELERFTRNAQLMQRVRRTLAESEVQRRREVDGSPLTGCIVLENLAGDVRRVQADAGSSDKLVGQVEAVSAEVAGLAAERLPPLLEELGQLSLGGDTESCAQVAAVGHLGRCLVALNRSGEFVAALVRVFVSPVLDASRSEAGEGSESLIRFLGLVEGRLLPGASARTRLLLSFSDCSTQLHSVPGLSVVSDVLALPILTYVQTYWPNVFMPAFPDAFAADFQRCEALISTCVSHMTPSEKHRFAKSEELSQHRKKWKTQVYSNLRAKECLHALEPSLSSSEVLDAAEEVQWSAEVRRQYWLRVTADIARQLRRIFSPQVFLQQLFGKSLRLALELLHRFSRAMHNVLSSESSGDSRAPYFMADVTTILLGCRSDGGEIFGMVWEAAKGGCGEHPKVAKLHTALTSAFDAVTADLRTILGDLERASTEHIVAAVAQQFGSVRLVPASFRMRNKAMPVRPSPYVDAALAMLSDYAATCAVIGDSGRQLLDTACSQLASQLGSALAGVIQTVEQQEKSMRRFAKAGGEAEEFGDTDKILIQLAIDARTFRASVMQSYGLDGASEGLEQLTSSVAKLVATYASHLPSD